jgi:hypothetical protein
MNLPYFALLKFLLVAALINISLYFSVSENPATNPLLSQKHTQGMMGVRHITDSRKLS